MNLWSFSPTTTINNKLLFIWHLLGCILVANLIVDLLKKVEKRSVQTVLCAMLMFTGTFGSILTLGREAVSQYQHFDADAIAVADYVEENTDPMGSLSVRYTAVESGSQSSGRPILCASGTWLYYHGMVIPRRKLPYASCWNPPAMRVWTSGALIT